MTINKQRLAAEMLGLGMADGGLKKLQITYEQKKAPNGTIEALFNPNKLTIARTVQWQQRRGAESGWLSSYSWQDFIESSPETLTVDLFFDTYESHSNKLSLGHLRAAVLPAGALGASAEATSVQPHIAALSKLAEVDQELHRPPYCELQWGKFKIFKGVLTHISKDFTMFMADGTPVRATANCSFVEVAARSYAVRAHELHSADVAKTRVVRRSETLQSIAAEEYDDPALWRNIARANGIVNPRALEPGTVLKIPPLRP
jgi:contractile injection system tube protein/LysM domain-containing protein